MKGLVGFSAGHSEDLVFSYIEVHGIQYLGLYLRQLHLYVLIMPVKVLVAVLTMAHEPPSRDL